MSVRSQPADPSPALAPLVARAQAAARSGGAPVLVCYTERLDCQDPLALLERIGPGFPPAACPQRDGGAVLDAALADEASRQAFRFFWEQPTGDLALAAGGVAQAITGSGTNRFTDAAARVETALRGAVRGGSVPDAPGPYALGGFSFFDRLDDAHWPGFKAAQLVVPRWLAVRQGRTCLGIVTTLVDALAPAQGYVAHLAAALRSLRTAAAGARAEALPPGPIAAGRCWPAATADARSAWVHRVQKAMAHIREGRLSKVVLARTLDLVCEAAPPVARLLDWLRGAYAGCYSFLMDPGAGTVFVGATPERIARFEGGRVHLAALAGTMPRGATAEADAAYARHLLASDKERDEHRIVVDSILAAVRPLGAVACAPEPEVLKLPNVQHLHTPIELVPHHPVGLLGLLGSLHPTPAVGGFPRDPAAHLIRDCEGFERGWYAAPMGWMNARGDGEFAAALRSATLTGSSARLYAGGGIVAGSDPEREFEETRIKLQPLLSALDAALGTPPLADPSPVAAR